MDRPFSPAQLTLISLTALLLGLGLYWIAIEAKVRPQADSEVQLDPPIRTEGDKPNHPSDSQEGKLPPHPSQGSPEQVKKPAPQIPAPSPAERPSALVVQVRKLYEGAEMDRAEQLYQKLLRQQGRAGLAALSTVRHAAWVRRGDKAQAEGQLVNAQVFYKKALEGISVAETERKLFGVEMRLKAMSVSSQQRKKLSRLMQRAEKAEKAGKIKEAAGLYQQALGLSSEAGPLKTKLYQARLRLLLELERREQVRWLKLARALADRKRWEKSLRAYRKAVTLGDLPAVDREEMLRVRRQLAARDMVRIPAGTVWLGSRRSADEQPIRQVVVPSFYIDRYEVTNAQYRLFVRDTGYRTPATWKDGFPQEGRGNYPVLGVSLDDALAYAKWIKKRLPTEIEWERAARGADRRLYPWGMSWESGRCNTLEEGMSGPTPVGSYRGGVSPFGVHDLLGNALEWTASRYQPYSGASGQESTRHVLRGGCWYFSGKKMSLTSRYPDQRTSRLASYGFRGVLDFED